MNKPYNEPNYNKSKLQKAVALGYDQNKDIAPRVLALGVGVMAEQIVQLAKANGITIQQDDTLVEILSKLEIESVIPLEAYGAVADILAYIYKMHKNKTLEIK